MKRLALAAVTSLALHSAPALAGANCNPEQATAIWSNTERRLAHLFGADVSTPPAFDIHETARDIQTTHGPSVRGYYNAEARRITVACMDGGQDVFALNVRHESTHHYLSTAFGDLPLWLEEGLAAYLESANPEDNTEAGPVNPPRLDEFIHLLRKSQVPPIETMLFEGEFEHTSGFYAVAWALVFAMLEHDDPAIREARRYKLAALVQMAKSPNANPDVISQSFLDYTAQEGGSPSAWQRRWHREIWRLR